MLSPVDRRTFGGQTPDVTAPDIAPEWDTDAHGSARIFDWVESDIGSRFSFVATC